MVANMPLLKHLSLGQCPVGFNDELAKSTAHTHLRGSGMICFQNPQDAFSGGKPSEKLWHEYAHLLHPEDGNDHSAVFWKALDELLEKGDTTCIF